MNYETIEIKTKRLIMKKGNEEDFFKVWTAKESYIKYRGQTLAALFNKLTFKRDTLFLNGNPLSETLCFSELEGCTVCICTRTPHSARFVKV